MRVLAPRQVPGRARQRFVQRAGRRIPGRSTAACWRATVAASPRAIGPDSAGSGPEPQHVGQGLGRPAAAPVRAPPRPGCRRPGRRAARRPAPSPGSSRRTPRPRDTPSWRPASIATGRAPIASKAGSSSGQRRGVAFDAAEGAVESRGHRGRIGEAAHRMHAGHARAGARAAAPVRSTPWRRCSGTPRAPPAAPAAPAPRGTGAIWSSATASIHTAAGRSAAMPSTARGRRR